MILIGIKVFIYIFFLKKELGKDISSVSRKVDCVFK